jgi:uncharacterized protein YndB with AHSA1/START domain
MTEQTALTFTVTRVLDAPRELVWKAWTDPEQVAKWWGPRGTTTPLSSIAMDLRPGGHCRMTMVSDTDGAEYPVNGEYLEVVEPERLAWRDEGFEGGSAAVMTITFNDLAGKTEIVIYGEAEVSEELREMAERGWASSVDRLDELLTAG